MTRPELAAAIKAAAYLEGNFVLSSGRRSRYYLDKYLFSTDPVLLKEIALHLKSLLPDKKIDRLAGVELGAVPLAASLSMETDIPYVIVRKQAKDYGTANLCEGIIEAGQSVVLIEDVLTTAGQAIDAAERLTDFGVSVEKVIYVIDRLEGAADNLANAGYDAQALITTKDMGIGV
jgi:orotate phosphoribosyltransferase